MASSCADRSSSAASAFGYRPTRFASTDNVPAFSGYAGQREALLDAGVRLYEFKPHPAMRKQLIDRYPRLADMDPVFALHAKSLVIDYRIVYFGTFNLDPRSANLNTEVGVLADNRQLARQVKSSIERDILPGEQLVHDASLQSRPGGQPSASA